MPIKRLIKLAVLKSATTIGLNGVVLDSHWRSQRLLILCWHKIAVTDEHLWNPGLCLSEARFVERLELIRTSGCSVLPLQEALARQRQGNLPPRAVALTVDDGDSSFYLKAWPILRRFQFPATLYWTTYYSQNPYAVFDPMVRYLLWKGREATLSLRNPDISMSLGIAADRRRAFERIYELSQRDSWSAAAKEQFLERLSNALSVDYASLKRDRVLHLINEDEARQMVAEGLDLQLHTHRHRVSMNKAEFQAEASDNANVLRAAGSTAAAHFCYPSGSYAPEFGQWLGEFGIRSATTCQPGLVSISTNPYFLPRFLDNELTGAAEFSAWLSGLAACLSGHQQMDKHGFR